MALHVVVGSGPVGTAIADELLARGETVRVITRSGTGPEGTERVAADASDASQLIEHTAGAEVIYNAVNPPYHQWTTQWPPLAAAFLAAAEASGAVLAIVDNLYPFGPVDGPMTATTPDHPSSVKGGVRKQMWDDAAGRGEAPAGSRPRSRFAAPTTSATARRCCPCWSPSGCGRASRRGCRPTWTLPHTWTNPGGRGPAAGSGGDRPGGLEPLVAGAERACRCRCVNSPLGRRSWTDGRRRGCIAAGVGAAGDRLFNATMRELVEMNYQFRRPFVLDTSATVAAVR